MSNQQAHTSASPLQQTEATASKEPSSTVQAVSALERFKVIKNSQKLEAEEQKKSENVQRGKKRRLAKMERSSKNSKQSRKQKSKDGSNRDDEGYSSKDNHTRSRQKRRRARSGKKSERDDRKHHETLINVNVNSTNSKFSEDISVISLLNVSQKIQNTKAVSQILQVVQQKPSLSLSIDCSNCQKQQSLNQNFQPQVPNLQLVQQNPVQKQQKQIVSNSCVINNSLSSSSGNLNFSKQSVEANSPNFSSGQTYKQLVNIAFDDNQNNKQGIQDSNIVSNQYYPPPTTYQTWQFGHQQSSLDISQGKAKTEGSAIKSKNNSDNEENKIEYSGHRLSVTSSKKSEEQKQRRQYENTRREGEKSNNYANYASEIKNRSQSRGHRNSSFTNEERERLVKTKICYDFLRGRCRHTAVECKYAHGQNDLKWGNKSGSLCRNFQHGFCKKKEEQCKYRHFEARKHEIPKLDIAITEIENKKDQAEQQKKDTFVEAEEKEVVVAQNFEQKINSAYYLNNNSPQIQNYGYNNGYFQQSYLPQNVSYESGMDQNSISQNQNYGYQQSYVPYQYPMYPQQFYPYYNPYQFTYQTPMPNNPNFTNPYYASSQSNINNQPVSGNTNNPGIGQMGASSYMQSYPAYYPSVQKYNYNFSQHVPVNYSNMTQTFMPYNYGNQSLGEFKSTQNVDNARLDNPHQPRKQQRSAHNRRN